MGMVVGNQKTIRGELESKKATEEHEYFRFHSVNTNVRKHVPFKLLLPVRKGLLDTRSKVSKGSLCNTVQLCFAFTLGLRPSLGKNEFARP